MDGSMGSPQPQFHFYEVVEVRLTPKTRAQGIAGRRGAVLGIAQSETEEGNVSYAVLFDRSSDTWSISEEDLVSTGDRKTRSDFYTGESLRVSQEGRDRNE